MSFVPRLARFLLGKRFLLLAAAAALIVLGARWRMIARDGSPVPYLDQWFGEGWMTIRPAVQGHVPLVNLLAPHNGHRMIPSRLLTLGLFRLNGQWDARLEAVANALLAAALCFPLLALVRTWLPPAALALFAGLVAWFYAQPIFYENPLWGFQSCFYLLIFFSLAQLHLMLGRRALSLGWWLGVASGLCATVSMGSGPLASALVAVVAAWRSWRAPDPLLRRELVFTTGAAAIVVAVGVAWLPPDLRGYLGEGPHGGAVRRTLLHALAFPGRDYSLEGLLIWLPFAAFAALALARRELSARAAVLLATGGWGLAQIAAMAYARSGAGPVLANRYYDVLAVGLIANAAAWPALWHLTGLHRRRRPWQLAFAALLAGWLGLVGTRATQTARVHRENIEPMYRALRAEQIERVNTFLQTDDPQVLEAAAPGHSPLPDIPALAGFLRSPELRAVLPAELRTPISLNFPSDPAAPSLANALPVGVPDASGKLRRGTFLPGRGASATLDVLSAPVAKAPRDSLLFQVAGDLRRGETELRLHDATGSVVATITDLRADTFRSIEVTVPGPAFRVEVIDRSPKRWLAFLEPTAMAPLSSASLFLIRRAHVLVLVGASLLAGIALLALTSRENSSVE